MNKSHTSIEENYLKAIYHLSEDGSGNISTNAIAKAISTAPASVTDMLKKLADKQLINYIPYKGVSLTEDGATVAIRIVRKHRLWEYFLVEQLKFSWHEVHEIAEQLEHINSPVLIQRLDAFLGYPRFDPHGEPIPDANGNIQQRAAVLLSELGTGDCGTIVGVKDDSVEFLQYLTKMDLVLGTQVTVEDTMAYDGSIQLCVNDGDRVMVSAKASENLYIKLKVEDN